MRRTSRRIRPNSRRRTSLRRNTTTLNSRKPFDALSRIAEFVSADIGDSLEDFEASGNDTHLARAEELIEELGRIVKRSEMLYKWSYNQYKNEAKRVRAAREKMGR